MTELIYAGVWLAGIVAAWDMVRRATGTRDVRAIAARLAFIEEQLRAQPPRIEAIETKLPELEKQIFNVRGMIQPVRRVGLGSR